MASWLKTGSIIGSISKGWLQHKYRSCCAKEGNDFTELVIRSGEGSWMGTVKVTLSAVVQLWLFKYGNTVEYQTQLLGILGFINLVLMSLWHKKQTLVLTGFPAFILMLYYFIYISNLETVHLTPRATRLFTRSLKETMCYTYHEITSRKG